MNRLLSVLVGVCAAAVLIGVVAAASVGWSAVSRFQVGTVQPNQTYDVGQGYAFNPGPEFQCYIMEINYIYNQPEKRPPKEWLIFMPTSFCLESGAGLLVDINLHIDPSIKLDGGLKGDYFAFIGPCTYNGNIGACAASRLYFTGGK